MKIEIWFEFASTYSYLTVSRAEALLSSKGIAFQWKPFLLGPIFRDKGMETSPFILDEIKGAYMWRDMERRCAGYGLPFVKPSPWPMNPLLPARVMTAVLNEPWCGDFARAVFTAQYAHGQNIADEKILWNVLQDSGTDPDHWLARAKDDATKADLRARTEQASNLGIFGAPSFVVGEELFWGDDRLEDAIDWAVSDKSSE